MRKGFIYHWYIYYTYGSTRVLGYLREPDVLLSPTTEHRYFFRSTRVPWYTCTYVHTCVPCARNLQMTVVPNAQTGLPQAPVAIYIYLYISIYTYIW